MESFTSIQVFFSQFNPIQLIAYLEAINCHPANQRFIHRFEHLIAIVLTIPEDAFENMPIDHDTFASFLTKLEDKLRSDFIGMEDVQPLPQNELVPLFHDHQTYFIFYGMMNNPVADWGHLLDMVRPVTNQENIEQASLYEEMREHLEWQNEVLATASSFEEFHVQSLSMYIPSAQFVNAVAELMIWNIELPGPIIPQNAFLDFHERHLLQETTMLFDDFSSRQIKIGDKYFRLHSQNAFYYFQNAYRNLLSKHCDLFDDLQFSFTERLQEICLQMFRGVRRIAGILDHPSQNDLFGGPGLNFNFDGNKIFVLCAIHREKNSNIIDQIEKQRKRLEEFQNRIKDLDTVAIILGKNVAGLIADKIEWIVVYVTESLDEYDIEPVSATNGFSLSYTADIVLLKQIFTELRTPMEFYKFLQEENWLLSKYRLTQRSGQMNRFAFYINEGRCYGRFAHIPEGVFSFEQRDWGAYIHKKLFVRYSSHLDFYKEVCRHYNDYFDSIKPYNENVFLLRSSIFYQSIYVVNCPGYFIPIWLPEDPSKVPMDAYRIGFDVLATMFADYIGSVKVDISKLLKSFGQRRCMIAIYPKEYFEQGKETDVPDHILASVSEANPLVFYSIIKRNVNLYVYIIYDYRFVHRLFQEESNNGERQLMRSLLESITNMFSAGDDETIARLINIAAPEGKKGYAVDHLSVDNYELVQYDNPLSPTKTDRAVVKRKIADFLKAGSYNPGNFIGEHAKTLVFEIYKYMQAELETEISNYIDAFTIYAYQQVEYNEGKIEQDKVRSGMHVERRRTYDIRKSNVSDYSKRTTMTSTNRYLLHTAIKVQPKGEKILTEADYCFMLAMAEQIIQLGVSWNFAEYNLETIEIEISDLFEYRERITPGIMDFEAYQFKEADKRLQYAKELFNKAAGLENAKDEQTATGITLSKEEIEKVIAAFDETFGVSFHLILDVIEIIARYEYELEREFPCYIDSPKNVAKIILNHINGATEIEVLNAIDYLTLKQGDFIDQQFLYHEILFQQQKRLTLCPFVQLQDKSLLFAREVVDGCRNNWMDILGGRLSFEYDEKSPVGKELKNIRLKKGRLLEDVAESTAASILGKQYVEARIDNFKRLSTDFARKESCGEIDLLCVNPEIKTLFVIDCKCLVRKVGLYQTHRNIEDFFKEKGYYTMLLRKKEFVKNNLAKILLHFNVADVIDWRISDAFIVNTTQYAEFRKGSTATFLLPEELKEFLIS